MKIRKALHIIIIAVAVVAIGACKGSKKFEIDGQLLNMDQGTIYVYSNDGLIPNIDTININGGRFEYSRAIQRNGTLILVFPNFSEIPIFAEPGEDVDLKGNAQQLNDLTVNGTKDNELMTKFRIGNFEQSPEKEKKNAELFIKEHPESAVANWLLYKYYIKIAEPNQNVTLKLAKQIKSAQPENVYINDLLEKLEKLCKGKTSGKLQFSATDVNGNTISTETLKGKKAIIYTAATWDYNNDLDRNIKQYLNDSEFDFIAVRISLDASSKQEAKSLEYSNYDGKLKIICQEKLFNSPILKTLCFGALGDNIVIDANGNIKKRNITSSEVEKTMK